jgi:hypothetical protein
VPELDTVLLRLRNSIIAHGYFRTFLVWPLSRTFHELNSADRVRTFEYMTYCRGMLLAFTRYGSERTRTVLEAAEGIEAQRRGAWRQDRIFHAWLAFRRQALNNESTEIEGNPL